MKKYKILNNSRRERVRMVLEGWIAEKKACDKKNPRSEKPTGDGVQAIFLKIRI